MKNNTICLGWDVGGWHSDRNSNSRDAIAIVDGNGSLVGLIDKNGAGGLAERFRTTSNTADNYWSTICEGSGAEDLLRTAPQIVVAIDTPLGFSKEFVALISNNEATTVETVSADNRYLYRPTERFLSQNGYAPLSPVKDMIGSQATKGIHVRDGQAPTQISFGVWQGKRGSQTITVIEGYPTVARCSRSVMQMYEKLKMQEPLLPKPTTYHQQFADVVNDLTDAAMCAIVAWMFAFQRDSLVPPIPEAGEEGWIWVPRDAVPKILKD